MLSHHSSIDLTAAPAAHRPVLPPSSPPAGSAASTLQQHFSTARTRSLAAGAQLFREGEPRAHVYLVTSGVFVTYRLRPDGRRQVTGFAEPGDLLGLGAATHHRCTAEARGSASVRSLPAAELHRAAEADPVFGWQLYRAVSLELRSAQDLLLVIGRLDAGQRIATFLCRLREANLIAGRTQDHIALPMTRCDIGDYLSLTTETVSRVLTRLVNRRIVARRSGSALAVLDAPALAAIAAGDSVLQSPRLSSEQSHGLQHHAGSH